MSMVGLWKAIRPLTTVASFMNTGAHPDDEHSAVLAYMSLGLGVNTSSVIANRGEGGQNEVGQELGNALGVIRTRELQEASKLCNVQVKLLSEDIDDPIYDFGFSKSTEETLEKWGEARVYERLIREIRTLRPDVVLPAFLNEESTHGHHRAMNVLTVRACEDAANPNVFPEHLAEGHKPWQVKKLYQPADENGYTVIVPIGDYDEVYGASYLQLGEASRYLHKSQGMGRDVHEGPASAYYTRGQSNHQEQSMFDGIAFTFADLAREVEDHQVAQDLHGLHKDAEEVIAAFPNFARTAERVHRMLSRVRTAIVNVQASHLNDRQKDDLLFRLNVKAEQLNHASAAAASLVVKVIPETSELVAGQTVRIAVRVFNGGSCALSNVRVYLNLPVGWTAVEAASPTSFEALTYNKTAIVDFQVTVPNDATLFHPYKDEVLTATVEYTIHGVQATVTQTPQQTVAVLPPLSLSMNPSATVLNTLHPGEPIPVTVGVRNYTPSATHANVSLDIPTGWTVEPQQMEVRFSKKGETKSATFIVQAPPEVTNGQYQVQAKACMNSKSGHVTEVQHQCVQVIEYPHIGRTYLIQPSILTISAFDLSLPTTLKVGYVSSGFDNIDDYLRQVGVDVTNLDANDVQFGDLSPYDTIVLGIRAYGFRPDLLASTNRLLDYVHNGGNLVVQYHKPEDNWKPELAPYPIKIGEPLIQWRVTDENSSVTLLAPDHALFHTPNRITDEDWQGWVQDRSAYNPCEWGEAYTELISTGDPGETEFTGTFLTANYGQGTYTYSSLAWYRQVPNLVPGSFRLFANMIASMYGEKD